MTKIIGAIVSEELAENQKKVTILELL